MNESLPRIIRIAFAHSRRTMRAALPANLTLACVVVGALSPAAVAQRYLLDEPWRWRRFTTEDGLPSSQIDEVCETGEGTIWVSTSSGLAWFDEYHWHALGPAQGVPAKPFSHIAADTTSGILAVVDGKLYRGDHRGLREVPIVLDGSGMHVRNAVPSADGGLIVLVYDARIRQRLLLKIAGDEIRVLDAPLGSHDSDIYSVWRPLGGELWVHAPGGLYRRAGESWELHLATDAVFDGVSHLEAFNGAGVVWNGRSQIDNQAGRGLWEWGPGAPPELAFGIERGFLDALAVSPQGTVLAVLDSGMMRTRENGIWSDPAKVRPRLYGVRSIRFQSNGDLWICTARGLLRYQVTFRLWNHWKDPAASSTNRVNEILEARDGSVWIAACDYLEIRSPGGVVQRLTQINGRSVRDSTGLAQDKEGNIWLTSGAVYEGAFCFDGSRWSHFGPEQGLNGLCHKARTDRQGRVWFLGIGLLSGDRKTDGTGAAVRVNGRFERWTTAEGLIHNRVYAFAEGLEGELWFGTLGGLSRWKAGTWTHWTAANGLRRPRISVVAVDENNTVWFADQQYGLGTIRDGAPHYLTTEDGLLSNGVQDIRADPCGGIWVSCHGGIMRFKDGRWYSFDAASGVGHSNLWPVLPTRDRVFVGTLGAGTAVLDRTVLEHCPLRVSLTKPIIHEGLATFRWRTAARATLLNSRHLETRYRLDDGVWSDWRGGRQATVAAEPGSHTFTTQARSRLAESPMTTGSVSFTVPYPLYRHPLVVFLTLGGLVALVSLIIMVIVRRRLEEQIIERRQAEEALRKSEERFDLAVRGSSDGLWDWPDTSNDREWWSPRFFELLGYEDGEFEPSAAKLREFLHPEDRDRTSDAVRTHLEDHVPYDVEYRLKMKSGEYRWFRARGQALWDEEGYPIRMAGSVRDVTKRKQAEDLARSRQDELAHVARLSTMGEMVSGIAHELNQPLSAIANYTSGCIRRLRSGATDVGPLMEGMERVAAQAQRAGEIIRRLRAFVSRRETKQSVLAIAPLIREVLHFVEADARQQDIKIQLELNDNLEPILADGIQIQQVVLNLVRNAFEAMNDVEGDGRVLTIQTRATEDNAVEVTVHDTGRGLSAEAAEKLFDPFFTTKAHGLGMGLSISRTIIDAHGGRLWAMPNPGGGTTLRFTVPCTDGEDYDT